jgi:mono/diheme cytochrome c family protein
MISSIVSSISARRRMLPGSALGVLALASAVSGLTAESPAPPAVAGEVKFMRDIAPILAQRCITCHGPKEPERDLRLDTFEGMTKGDHPAVVPGEPEHSGMMHAITEEDSSSRMPRDADPLTPAQIDLIRRWIQAGAIFDGPDPKTPYAVAPKAPGAPPAAVPHPVRPPAAPSDRKPEEGSKAGESERGKEKS